MTDYSTGDFDAAITNEEFKNSVKISSDCRHSKDDLFQAYDYALEMLGKNVVMIRNAGSAPCREIAWRTNARRSIRLIAAANEEEFLRLYAEHLGCQPHEWRQHRLFVQNSVRIMEKLGIEEPAELKQKREALISGHSDFFSRGFRRTTGSGHGNTPRH